MEIIIDKIDSDEDDMADQVTIGRDARFNFLLTERARNEENSLGVEEDGYIEINAKSVVTPDSQIDNFNRENFS